MNVSGAGSMLKVSEPSSRRSDRPAVSFFCAGIWGQTRKCDTPVVGTVLSGQEPKISAPSSLRRCAWLGIRRLVAFFSRVPQPAPPWRRQSLFDLGSAGDPAEGASREDASSLKPGAVCHWCLAERDARGYQPFSHLVDCARHSSIEQQGKVFGL